MIKLYSYARKAILAIISIIAPLVLSAIFEPLVNKAVASSKLSGSRAAEWGLAALGWLAAPFQSYLGQVCLAGLIGLLVGWWSHIGYRALKSRSKAEVRKTRVDLRNKANLLATNIETVFDLAPTYQIDRLQAHFEKELPPIQISYNSSFRPAMRKHLRVDPGAWENAMAVQPWAPRWLEHIAAHINHDDIDGLRELIKNETNPFDEA